MLLANSQRRKVKVLYKGDPQRDSRLSLFVTRPSRPGLLYPLGEVDLRFFRELQKGNLELVQFPTEDVAIERDTDKDQQQLEELQNA